MKILHLYLELLFLECCSVEESILELNNKSRLDCHRLACKIAIFIIFEYKNVNGSLSN